MWDNPMATAVVLVSVAVVFILCCRAIVRAAFLRQASRTDVRAAWYWALAFAAMVVGCLALTDAQGEGTAALFAALACAASLLAGWLLTRAWRAAEQSERDSTEELRRLVERYRTAEDSIENRCARAARAFDLTRREEDMLRLLLEGRTRSQIARELVVSGDTVKTHIRNLYRKMGVSGKEELADAMEPARGRST